MTDGTSGQAWKAFTDQIDRVFNSNWPEAAAQPISTKQAQYAVACVAVGKLLQDTGKSDAAEHFHKLAEALQDVADGLSHPLFKVEKLDKHAAGKRGRQPDTGETWRIRSSLCIGVQFLIASGLDQDAATAFVVRKHRKQLTKLLRPGADLESSLPTWLKSFATDAVRNDVALSGYKHGMSRLAEVRDVQPPAAIRAFGEQLILEAAAEAAELVKSK